MISVEPLSLLEELKELSLRCARAESTPEGLLGAEPAAKRVVERLIWLGARIVQIFEAAGRQDELNHRAVEFLRRNDKDSLLNRTRVSAWRFICTDYIESVHGRDHDAHESFRLLASVVWGIQTVPHNDSFDQLMETGHDYEAVCWNPFSVCPDLLELLEPNMDASCSGYRAVQNLVHEVRKLKFAESKDHLWGCFLLKRCAAAMRGDHEEYDRTVKCFSVSLQAKILAIKDAASDLMPLEDAIEDDTCSDTTEEAAAVDSHQATLDVRQTSREGSEGSVIAAVAIDIGEESYVLRTDLGKALSISPEHKSLLTCFATKVAYKVPTETVETDMLNAAVGADACAHGQQSERLRRELHQLRKLLGKLGKSPGNKGLIVTIRGCGAQLNGEVQWRLSKRLKRVLVGRKSVAARPTDSHTLQDNTEG
ncbi:MAG: hypothetical protein HQ567_14305 [Candidatus Nealsonbacteria bacterium]|nr:hypothetical protein [Candidatus Nealsonbacteria bacterium]